MYASIANRTMSFTGTVKDGVVVLPADLNLPDGIKVEFTILGTLEPPSFADRYAVYIGAADDLPPDLAMNLDHYVHGHGQS